MPRSLVLSNGSLFLALDERHQIRELTYPQVGLYNHLNGKPIKMGFWVDGRLSWTDDSFWQIEQVWDGQNGAWKSTLRNDELGLAVNATDQTLDGLDGYIRRMAVASRREAEVRIFFYHPLEIQESDIGDTALFHPGLGGMVHFKGERYFLFGGRTAKDGLNEYVAGIKDFGDLEGTWRDAEDGKLSMNPIAQGSVDSTLCLSLDVQPDAPSQADYWILCGSSIEDLETKERALRSLDSGAPPATESGPDQVPSSIGRSHNVLRCHLDGRGGLIAAIDSDIMKTNRANYAYVWTRDGALASTAFDRMGDPAPARKFFEFCAELLRPHRPFFLQKYRPDGQVGATWHPWIWQGTPEVPLQEDETALVLWAIAEHSRTFGEWTWIGHLWELLVLPAATFLCEFRDPETQLPKPSYDLWEERRAVHAYTTATVVAGLRGAAEIAQHLRKKEEAEFQSAAEAFGASLLEQFVSPDHRLIARSLVPLSDGGLRRDQTPDASLLYLILLGVLDTNDPLASDLVDRIERELWVPGHIGGLARYSDDYYFRVSHEVPGNAWIITTLWLARARLMLNRGSEDLERAKELFAWAESRMSPSGMLPEQVHPITGEHLSVAPLAWSHAEHVITALAIADYESRR